MIQSKGKQDRLKDEPQSSQTFTGGYLMKLRHAVFSLILIFTLALGGYAMIQTITLEELTIEAEVIGVGTLRITKKLPKDKDGWVKIESTIVLSEILKGSLKPGEEVVVETLEGMEDMPLFEPRNRFIVFLQKAQGKNMYQTTNMIQGLWPLDSEGKPLGMGLGTTKTQLLEMVKKTQGQKPKTPVNPVPAF